MYRALTLSSTFAATALLLCGCGDPVPDEGLFGQHSGLEPVTSMSTDASSATYGGTEYMPVEELQIQQHARNLDSGLAPKSAAEIDPLTGTTNKFEDLDPYEQTKLRDLQEFRDRQNPALIRQRELEKLQLQISRSGLESDSAADPKSAAPLGSRPMPNPLSTLDGSSSR